MAKKHEAKGQLEGQAGSADNAAPVKDNVKKVDQSKVTSKVKVDGAMTTRTFSDGAEQRLAHPSEEAAKAYAASVREQEG